MTGNETGTGDPVRTAIRRGSCSEVPELGARYFEEYLEKIRRSLEGLEEEALWTSPPGTNSIGNLLVHLAGNLRAWILGGLGGRSIPRDRGAEFTTGHRAGALVELEGVVGEVCSVLRGTPSDSMPEPARVQGYELDRLGVVVHAVEHMAYHTGQIVLLAKIARGPAHGIEFYPQHAGE